MAEPGVFDSNERVFIFAPEAASGYASAPLRESGLVPAFNVHTVAAGAGCTTIHHRLNQAGLGVVIMTTWPTEFSWNLITADDVIVCFTSPPIVPSLLYWEMFF
jgi:hypothetical protein